ncbi:MAG: ABC transporter substrate-binding protein [Bacteroidales bacterium]|nr:ABC transporter substrate-binding protein [Bacteroidales bacterium]
MRRFLLFLSVLLCWPATFAQTSEVKTVLFLLPFFGEEYSSYNSGNISTVADVDNEPMFSLVSFWEGAQLALDEYENSFQRINVVVKDITYDNVKLMRILEDEQLMNQVDLIIGPFFAPQFEIAANYAKTHQIPIVNPFTSKQDILENNEYVYKVQSSKESEAEMVKQFWRTENRASDILIWTERGADIPALRACERYFTKLDVPYEFALDDGKNNIKKHLKPATHQVVLPFFQQQTTVIANMRSLGVEEDFPNTVFVIPEEWLDIEALEVEYLNKLNVHFFSDYFVDEEKDSTLVFISNFVERYDTPPDLKRFSFQGYDITKYFVELMLHDFDTSKVRFSPIAMKFNFQKTENGGYENHGMFLLQLKDYKVQVAD